MKNGQNKSFTEEELGAVIELQERIEKAKQNPPTFLLIGRTGVGKSSTINSLLGKEVAHVGHYEPTTMEVKHFDASMDNGFKFKIVDTPGLCDDLEEKNNDYTYLELMRSNISSVDSMWFVTRIDDTRVSRDEKRGIQLISECFKKDIWKNSIIVFTFSDTKKAESYPEALVKRTELIRKEIALAIKDDKIASNIPSIAVSNIAETNPDGEKWLPELFSQVVKTISNESFQAFFLGMLSSITPPQSNSNEKADIKNQNINDTKLNDLKKNETIKSESSDQAARIPVYENQRHREIIQQKLTEAAPEILATATKLAGVGAGIGAAIGTVVGPVGTAAGAALGAAAGAVVGAVSAIFKLFGGRRK